jgi:hypothetical protein
VALEHFFLQVLRFSPFNIIPPMLHTHLHLRFALTRKTESRGLGTSQKQCPFSSRGTLHRKVLSLFVSSLKGSSTGTTINRSPKQAFHLITKSTCLNVNTRPFQPFKHD